MTEQILKSARECRTKEQWENWLTAHGELLSTNNHPKLLEEIFRLLEKDAQSLQYGVALWAALLNGCISSWNLELGLKISRFIQKLKSPQIALPMAKLYLESGFPRMARQIVTHAQRMANIETKQKLQLDTVSCSTFIEEGKRSQASRILTRIEKNALSEELTARDRADILSYVARTLFLLGRYKDASRIFETIAEVYYQEQLWEFAAKSFFNAAAGFENAGEGSQDYTFGLVERCRRLSEEHNLKGTLAHCEAFYGHNDYWRGNFAGAREHYRRALQHYPTSDNSYRRLHLLSMLAFTYLRTGRIHLAKKFGQMTLQLASQEETDRFALRYDHLEAELLWENGNLLDSQNLLKRSTAPLLQKGVHTLEDLAIVSRYIYQSSLLNEENIICDFKINPDLSRNVAAQQEYIHSLAHFWLMKQDFTRAEEYFQKCLRLSESIEDQYHRALSYLGLIEIGLMRSDSIEAIESHLKKFEIHSGRMVETPLKNRTKIILAAIQYRKGAFEKCKELLQQVSKINKPSMVDEFLAKTWLSTMEGHSTRFPSPEHLKLIARMSKVYFQPSLTRIAERQFVISKIYTVDLDKHPALAQMLTFLLNQPHFRASPEDLQSKVWQQSTLQLGWQQKIRNSVNRLRQFFPYTMAPIFIYGGKNIQLFSDAITIEDHLNHQSSHQNTILELLRKAPYSSLQLSGKLQISPATTKRILRQLTDSHQITSMKIGRNVFYQHPDQ